MIETMSLDIESYLGKSTLFVHFVDGRKGYQLKGLNILFTYKCYIFLPFSALNDEKKKKQF